jgi:hypothetical protein
MISLLITAVGPLGYDYFFGSERAASVSRRMIRSIRLLLHQNLGCYVVENPAVGFGVIARSRSSI